MATFEQNQDLPHFEQADGERNVLEISRIPKNCTSRALLTLLITHTKIKPRRVDICLRSEGGISATAKEVALVAYRNERDTLISADRIRRSPFGQKWDINFKRNDTIRQP